MPIRLPIISKFDNSGVLAAKSGLDRLGSFARSAGTLLAGAFVAAGVAATAFGVSSLRAADDAEKISRGLENAIRNAGVFGNTDKDIQKATTALEAHAAKLGELIGVDDEVLLSIEKTFMAVPELAGRGTEGIQKLIETTADVAAGANVDIESVGKAFIKIAGDEETALGKLVRLGVVFTDSQKANYQALLDANDQIGAQSYLIDQLGTMYAGAAEATASPLARISVMWENFQETIGAALLPAIEKLVPMLGAALATMAADPRFQQFLTDLTQAFIDLLPSVMDLLPPLMELFMTVLPSLIALTPAFVSILENLTAMFAGNSGQGEELTQMFIFLAGVIGFVSDAVLNLSKWSKEQYDLMGKGQANIFALLSPLQFLITAFNNVAASIQNVINWWNALFSTQSSKPLVGEVRAYTSGGLRLAEGGVVMPRAGGTLATIGEAGQAEAVIPLDRLDRMMSGRSGGAATYNINVNGGLATSAEVGRAVVDAIKKFERVSGNVFVSA